MMRKMSFLRLLIEDLKRRGWLVLASVITFFVALPVKLLLDMDAQLNQLEEGITTVSEVRDAYISFVSYGVTGFSAMVLGAVAFVSGISGFAYIHSREKLDFYHSLPIRKKNWFRIQYASGLLLTAVPYLVCLMVCVVIGDVYGLSLPGDMGRILEAYVLHMVYYIVYYSIAVIGTILTGKLVVSAMAFPVLMFLGPAYAFVLKGLTSTYFDTYSGLGALEDSWWKFLSPGGLCMDVEDGMREYFDGGSFPGIRVIALFLLAVCLILTAQLLFVHRKTEAAGSSLAFKKLEVPAKILIVVPSAVGIGLFVSDMTHTNRDIWFFGGIVFCVLLLCAVVEFIYRPDIREVFKPGVPFAVSLVLSLGIGCAFRLDWFGYDSYLPAEGEIVSMSVYQANMDNRGRYVNGDIFWGSVGMELLEDTALTDFEPVYRMAENGVEKAGRQDTGGKQVFILFELDNGRKVSRKYRVNEEVYAEQQQRLFENQEYLENLYAIYQAPEYGYFSLDVTHMYGYSDTIRMNETQRSEFLETYKEELRTATYEELTGDSLVGHMTLYFGSRDSYCTDDNYPLLKRFTGTLSLLEKMGIRIPERINPEDVSSVEVYGIVSSRTYEGINGNTVTEEIGSGNKLFTDPADIRKIVECLNYVDSSGVAYNDRNTGGNLSDCYSIYISYKDSQQFVSFYLGKDEAPMCITSAFES